MPRGVTVRVRPSAPYEQTCASREGSAGPMMKEADEKKMDVIRPPAVHHASVGAGAGRRLGYNQAPAEFMRGVSLWSETVRA